MPTSLQVHFIKSCICMISCDSHVFLASHFFFVFYATLGTYIQILANLVLGVKLADDSFQWVQHWSIEEIKTKCYEFSTMKFANWTTCLFVGFKFVTIVVVTCLFVEFKFLWTQWKHWFLQIWLGMIF
jgi:hypothetical protein